MITTKYIASDIKEVPASFIFSYFTKLDSSLFNGETIKIKSPFTKEKNPSFVMYVKNGSYIFKDFSSGKSGSAVDMVMTLFKESYPKSVRRILDVYNSHTLDKPFNISTFKEKKVYSLQESIKRQWNVKDRDYWTRYNIGSSILSKFNVCPIAGYSLIKEDKQVNISGDYMYAYMKEDGSIYKIYQPFSNLKFLKISNYVQGSEQVENKPYLIYTKALKDIMSIYSFGFNLDLKAPDSENTLLPKHVIENDLRSYKRVMVLFDNDEAGINSASKYKDKYGIKPIFLSYGEKDVSDHINKFGAEKVYYWLAALIRKTINDE